MSIPTNWAERYFVPMYADVYAGPLSRAVDTHAEVEFLAETFADAKGEALLDIGCGFGRHLRPMAARGFRVAGIDRFAHLMARIPKRGRRVAAADMRRLPFADGSFGGAWCLFNSFGYFPDRENVACLKEWARVLKPGSGLVMQIPNRPAMAKIAEEYVPSRMMTEGFVVSESYGYDGESKSLVGRGEWEMKGQRHAWEFAVRMYTRGELERALGKAGFDTVETAEGFCGEEFADRSSPQMVIVARKR